MSYITSVSEVPKKKSKKKKQRVVKKKKKKKKGKTNLIFTFRTQKEEQPEEIDLERLKDDYKIQPSNEG